MSDYWFERQARADGREGRGVYPTDWRGRAVIAGFVGAMVGGGVLFLLIGLLTKLVLLGAAVFAVCAIAGAGTFLWATATKCDPKPRPHRSG